MAVARQISCLNTTEWRFISTVTTRMIISKRFASTVFDRSNFSIMDVVGMSDPVPVRYKADDLFLFYDLVFKIQKTSKEFITSTPFSFLLTMSSHLQKPTDTRIQSFGGSQRSQIQEFLATPIIVYNDGWFGKNTTDPNTKNKTLALASRSYRVNPISIKNLICSY